MSDRRIVYCSLSVVAALTGSGAVAETTTGVRIGAEGGYASNPFLGATGETGALTARATVEPSVVIASATGEIGLTGRVSHIIYSRRYNDQTDWSAGATVSKVLSPLSSFNLRAGYSNRISNALGAFRDPLPDDPTEIETVGRRTQTIDGSADFTTTLSPRGSLTVQAFGSSFNLSGGQALRGRDYKRFGGTLSYSHALDEDLRLGVSMNYARNDFDDATLGNSNLYSPSLTAEYRITPRLRLSGNIGASFSDIKQGGLSIKQTSFAGALNLCRDNERTTFCLNAQRAVRPTSAAGLSTVSNIGFSGSYKLTPRSSIGARANYARSSALSTFTGLARELSAYTGGIQYSRDLSMRLSLTTEASYTNRTRSAINENSNFTARVGVTYRLGRTQ